MTPTERAVHCQHVFDTYHDSLVLFLRTRLHSVEEAKSVLQEAYVQVLGLNAPQVSNLTYVSLMKTAQAIATNRLKSEQARDRLILQKLGYLDIQQESHPVQFAPNGREQLVSVSKAMERLPPLCRRAFILVRYEGMSYDEAAAEMKLHPRKVRKFVQRAFRSCQCSAGVASSSSATLATPSS